MTMQKRNYTYLIFLLLLAITSSCAQPKNETTNEAFIAEKLDRFIKTYAEYEQFNGAVLVANEGDIIYKNAFGWANMEWDIPNTTHTKFRLASVTKQFTAMLIMQLVSENKLELHQPIAKYLPDYPKPQAEQITIHHLLTHSSGIPNYTSFPGYRKSMRNPTNPSELVKRFADSTLKFMPGERFNYSNSGYVLLGYIIEKITKQPFETVLQDKILGPLQMVNSGYEKGQALIKESADGYYRSGSNYQKANSIDLSVSYSAGGMHSTVEDLFLWDKALYSEKLLPKKYLDTLFYPHQPIGGTHYAYGWSIGEMPIGNTQETVAIIDHDGVINGFTSLIVRIPSSKSTIIILNNTGRAPINHMARGITGILYNKPYNMPVQSVATVLSKKITDVGLSKTLEFYQSIKASPEYYINENEINLLAYDYLETDNTAIALALFKLNMEAFPNAFNVYDSYAEALLKLGKTQEAITNYKKSLELNPKNNNAKRMLKTIMEK